MPHVDEAAIVGGHLRPGLEELPQAFVEYALPEAHARLQEAIRDEPQEQVPVLQLRNGTRIFADADGGLDGARHGQDRDELATVGVVDCQGEPRDESGNGRIHIVAVEAESAQQANHKLVCRVEAHQE